MTTPVTMTPMMIGVRGSFMATLWLGEGIPTFIGTAALSTTLGSNTEVVLARQISTC